MTCESGKISHFGQKTRAELEREGVSTFLHDHSDGVGGKRDFKVARDRSKEKAFSSSVK
jgi:hypothetical protein